MDAYFWTPEGVAEPLILAAFLIVFVYHMTH